MTFELLISTQNPGKLHEYQRLFAGLDITYRTLNEVGLAAMDVEENADTFAGNAELKACAYAQAAKLWALADDSGLCVDALDGAPGVYSARYAGPGASDAERRAKLLQELRDIPPGKRTAYFMCVIVLYNPFRQTPYIAEGRVNGTIATEESTGPHGFGYDAIFIPEGYTVTLADIPTEEKNQFSHRARAAEQMVPIIKRIQQGLDGA